jgi:hypothetical protein
MAEGAPKSHERPGSKTRSLRGAAKQANARARDLELRVWNLLEEGARPVRIQISAPTSQAGWTSPAGTSSPKARLSVLTASPCHGDVWAQIENRQAAVSF